MRMKFFPRDLEDFKLILALLQIEMFQKSFPSPRSENYLKFGKMFHIHL